LSVFPQKSYFFSHLFYFLLLFPCLVPPIFLFLSRSRALYRWSRDNCYGLHHSLGLVKK
jgi:hypothetical protein